MGHVKIVFIGKEAGYGKAIKIRYGHHYEALYGHLRGFAKNINVGNHVHKGQLIGYVGETGWATGPHLHFGFFVNGIAKNWLAMRLPSMLAIPHSYFSQFVAVSKRLMAELELYQDTQLAVNSTKINTRNLN